MNIYDGPFSTIRLVADTRLLIASWQEEAKILDPEGVKFEIGRILDYVKQYAIRNIIVDTRNYVFQHDAGIQAWINHTYMPLIMDNGVMKYALVVASDVNDRYSDFEDMETVLPLIEYFTDIDKAKVWIES
jgi:hypothetical protein